MANSLRVMHAVTKMAATSTGIESAMIDLVGIIVTVLQLGQFLPQHWEMYVEKSVEGISPWLLFFGALYTHFSALSMIITDGAPVFFCKNTSYRCLMDGLPMVQILGSALLSSTMWYWFLKYEHTAEDSSDTLGMPFADNFSGRQFYKLFVATAISSTFIMVVLLYTVGPSGGVTLHFADASGLFSAALNFVMWIPQIAVTWSRQSKGALSALWVLMSLVMDVLASVYLNYMGVPIAVYANNIADGVQTSILLLILLRIEAKHSHPEYDPLDGAENARDGASELEILRKSYPMQRSYLST